MRAQGPRVYRSGPVFRAFLSPTVFLPAAIACIFHLFAIYLGRSRSPFSVNLLQFALTLPLHDRNGTDGICRRTIDYLSTDSEVDDRVPGFVH